jgi:hypothetical protein
MARRPKKSDHQNVPHIFHKDTEFYQAIRVLAKVVFVFVCLSVTIALIG